jgi:hypothetical protein
MSESKPTGMKSSYELALERLEKQGIKRPEDSQLTDEDRRQMAEARNRAEAKLAELEILHKDRLGKSGDPMKRQEEEEHYRLERRRIEEDRDRKIEAIRRGKG